MESTIKVEVSVDSVIRFQIVSMEAIMLEEAVNAKEITSGIKPNAQSVMMELSTMVKIAKIAAL